MFGFLSEKSALPSAPASAAGDRRGAFPATFKGVPDFQQRMTLSGRWILSADILALALSYFCGVLFVLAARFWAAQTLFVDVFSIVTVQSFIVFWSIGLVILLWLDAQGHYRQRLPYWEALGQILAAAGVGFVIGGFVEFVSSDNTASPWFVFCWPLFAFFSVCARKFVRRHLRKKGEWAVPAIMIGEGPTALLALRALSREKQMGFDIVEQLPASVLSSLKKTRAWKQMLMLHDANYVFLALEGSDLERYQPALRFLPRARVPCSIIPPWLGLPSSTMTPHHFIMQDVMMLHDTNRLKLPLPRLLKRLVDISLSGMALVALLPLFAVVGIVVRLDGGPAFFKQPRVGRGGKLFQCYKFRSMRLDAEACLDRFLAENPEAAEEWHKYQKLKVDVRVTKLGQILRRLSIDELPQLINVLRGDMSLVGPRPCLAGQEIFYAEDFSLYESVRPGITGPWQVSGRNQLTFKERVDLEAWYARNWSLWLDIVIMLKTVPTLLKRGQAF